MDRRSLLLAGLAASAGAAATVTPAAAEVDAADEGDAVRIMNAPGIVVPVLRDGRLINHLFFTVEVTIAERVDIWQSRARNHFLRDALVRAAYREPLADPEGGGTLRTARAETVFRAAAVEALGANAIESVRVVRVYRAGEREPVSS